MSPRTSGVPIDAAAPLDRIVFQSELVTLGEFRCAREHPRFADSGPITQHCFVFPRSAVTIEHERARPFVANPNVVTLYNRGQRYRRGAISPQGDRCDWFGVERELARDVVRRFDPTVDERSGPFALPRGRSDAALYLAQRELFEAADSGEPCDGLALEERVVVLLERVLELAYASPPRNARPRARGDATLHVERLLSERWREDLRLSDLARAVGLSVFHLCHTFRSETGTTLHQYRHQLRMRASIEALREDRRPLIELALELGFSSHSHFSSAFQREFGVPPSRWRAAAEPSSAGSARSARAARRPRPERRRAAAPTTSGSTAGTRA
jgi:AraC-like DNA-binding protein